MLDMNRKETFSCAKPLEWRKLSCQHGAVAHFYMIRMSLTFHSDDYNQHISSTVIFFFIFFFIIQYKVTINRAAAWFKTC